MPTTIKVTRIPGESTVCHATLHIDVDLRDPAGIERFSRLLREMIPEEERAQFIADFYAAGREAGFQIADVNPPTK